MSSFHAPGPGRWVLSLAPREFEACVPVLAGDLLWLALTRRGLAPRKIRQASLGTITTKLSRARYRRHGRITAIPGLGLNC